MMFEDVIWGFGSVGMLLMKGLITLDLRDTSM